MPAKINSKRSAEREAESMRMLHDMMRSKGIDVCCDKARLVRCSCSRAIVCPDHGHREV